MRSILIFILGLFSLASVHAAEPIEFKLKTELVVPHESETADKNAPLAIGQQALLVLDLQTTRWFSSGTKLAPISVPNLVIKQTNLQAANYSQTEGSKVWAHQRWDIPVYPQASGNYEIPPVAVDIQVTTEDGRVIKKTLMSDAVKFSAALPDAALTKETPWVTSADVQVDQTWSQSADSIKVGDVITRKVTIKAADSMAILLPDMLKTSNTDQIRVYPDPSQLQDTYNRGEYFASRVESETYLVQDGGTLQLPALEILVWDPTTQSLETKTLEGKSFVLKHTFKSWMRDYWPWLALAASGFIGLIVLWRMTVLYFKTHPKPDWYLFYKSLVGHKYNRTRALIYQKLRRKTGLLSLGKYSDDDAWQQNSDTVQSQKPTKQALKETWQGIQDTQNQKASKYQALPALRRLEK